MKTLLTVDLDYWTNCFKTFRPSGGEFLGNALNLSKESWVIQYHHHILPLIPKGTQRIINVDFHNDIVGESAFEDYEDPHDGLNEGTWGNFLPKSVKWFEWYYPQEKACVEQGGGLCIDENGAVCKDYPINYLQKRDYRNADLTGVETLVICVSPQWAYVSDCDPYLRAVGVDPWKLNKNPLKIK
jgi:hypothetical protein